MVRREQILAQGDRLAAERLGRVEASLVHQRTASSQERRGPAVPASPLARPGLDRLPVGGLRSGILVGRNGVLVFRKHRELELSAPVLGHGVHEDSIRGAGPSGENETAVASDAAVIVGQDRPTLRDPLDTEPHVHVDGARVDRDASILVGLETERDRGRLPRRDRAAQALPQPEDVLLRGCAAKAASNQTPTVRSLRRYRQSPAATNAAQ
jgi:hypothetical protein